MIAVTLNVVQLREALARTLSAVDGKGSVCVIVCVLLLLELTWELSIVVKNHGDSDRHEILNNRSLTM